MPIILRNTFIEKLHTAFRVNPVVALLGPRQCGKTTLAREFAAKNALYFDLENPIHLAQLAEPMLAFSQPSSLIVIDEIQRRPELFSILRVLVDERQRKKKFLILGSASRDLIKQSSESLAGRISYLEMTPFSYEEVDHFNRLWLRGGFPDSYLAKSNNISIDWRYAYVTTFLERDIPNLGIQVPAATLRRFWMMLAHYHANIFNASEIGQSLGIAHTTVRHYLDILTGTFMIRELRPWTENINKRQIKSPKIYFRDSGIFHALLGITEQAALYNHPKLGASWEGIALEEVIRHHSATIEEAYFWGIHSQAELDLLIVKNGKKIGFEFKYADAPTLTRSMQVAFELLNLDELNVIHPGNGEYQLAKKIRAIGIEKYC